MHTVKNNRVISDSTVHLLLTANPSRVVAGRSVRAARIRLPQRRKATRDGVRIFIFILVVHFLKFTWAGSLALLYVQYYSMYIQTKYVPTCGPRASSLKLVSELNLLYAM